MHGTGYADDKGSPIFQNKSMLKTALLTHNSVMSKHDLKVGKDLMLHSTQLHQMAVVSQIFIAYSTIYSLSPEVQNANFQMAIFLPRIKYSIFLPSLQLAKAMRLTFRQ